MILTFLNDKKKAQAMLKGKKSTFALWQQVLIIGD